MPSSRHSFRRNRVAPMQLLYAPRQPAAQTANSSVGGKGISRHGFGLGDLLSRHALCASLLTVSNSRDFMGGSSNSTLLGKQTRIVSLDQLSATTRSPTAPASAIGKLSWSLMRPPSALCAGGLPYGHGSPGYQLKMRWGHVLRLDGAALPCFLDRC